MVRHAERTEDGSGALRTGRAERTLPETSRRAQTTRRQVLATSAALAAGLFAPPAFARDEARGSADEQRLDTARREAIRRGCVFLAGEDGRSGQLRKDGGFGENDQGVVALTALSVLALMADGSTDGRGPYGYAIRRGLNFLMRWVEEREGNVSWHDGYFYHPRDKSSRMHGQGYATLALATALGTSTGKRYERIHGVLEKAVACIEQAQTVTGGFGYDPVPTGDHEGSVTVTVAQGLRAARDAGLVVDPNVVQHGLRYLERSQKKTRGPDDGSFKYSLYVDRSSYALTAAALSSFYLYGRYTDLPGKDVLERGMRYLLEQTRTVLQTHRWYYYGNFYAAWTCWQRDGDEWDPRSGGYWATWHRLVYPDLLAKQRAGDGGWSDEFDQFEFGDVLPTAFAILTLAIPDEVLPIFQR